jgi:LmbE family N-acetylglucosaminyl deacetylase
MKRLTNRVSSACIFAALLLISASVLFGAEPRVPVKKLKQGAELLKTDIMGVFAHPDDETGVSAVMAKYARDGRMVSHVYCTRGEGGGNMVGTQWGASLGILREMELRDCLEQIGVRQCYFLDRLDWAYTESVEATFNNWGKEETLGALVRHIRALRPDVIITMNPAPTPGQHGHHQAAGVLATEAFDAAADPTRFPDQIWKEGLSAWQVRKLYYSGNLATNIATIATTNLLSDGHTPAQLAGAAAAHHRSQGFGDFTGSYFGRRPHVLTLVKAAVPVNGPETDLLQGLPPASVALQRLDLGGVAANDSKIEVTFVPRPAVRRYQKWVKEQAIEHVAAKLAADVPVVVGEPQIMEIEVRNNGAERASGELRLNAPERWLLDRTALPYSIGPGATAKLAVRVTAPQTAKEDGEIIATIAGTGAKAVGHAHPVPHAIVPRMKWAPSIYGAEEGWPGVSPLRIAPTDLVQGKVENDEDSSAIFRVAHNGSTLFVDVQVKDDHIVSNIAPNDIRGHWRSDSVEICVDPSACAEDTMGCFKLGIFPFDTTGIARAERDADAKQGPIEETAPRTRVSSRRIDGGYQVQAAIPFSEIGISLKRSHRIGFNIIIYDGDKTDAAIGENINKSRIAWSPRSGVNGRPEDWGRMDLE